MLHARAEPGRELARIEFGPADLPALRAAVQRVASAYVPARAADVVLTVHEVAVNSLIHGGGHGCLCVHHTGNELVFDVHDDNGTPNAPAVQPLSADATRGRGLWLAERLTDELHIDTGPDATSVRLHLLVDADRR